MAVAPDATTEAKAIGKFRAQGYRQEGRSQLVNTSAKSVNLGNDSSALSSSLPTVVVSACIDVGQVGAVNASGMSVVPAERPKYLIEQLSQLASSLRFHRHS